MKFKTLVIASALISTSLWTLKLFTAAYGDARCGVTGIILRSTPGIHNRDYFGESDRTPAPGPEERVFLIRGDEWGYPGRELYLALVDYGYAFSTALSILLVWMWVRRVHEIVHE